MKKAYVILGNGFTIDFLHYFEKHVPEISEKIDVKNLFHFGDIISTPWDDRPGFLSYKNCPALWTLGARTNQTPSESTSLIEEIITCANMFFDFVNEPKQKTKRLELMNSSTEKIYLRAYSELITYLRHLFSCYNSYITDDQISQFVAREKKWGWLNLFRSFSDSTYDKIVFITYNYDVWLERILQQLHLEYDVVGFEASEANIQIIKPHGSISFVPKDTPSNSYSINYQLDMDGLSMDKLILQYNDLTHYTRGAIIPPAGDSMRLGTTAPWAKHLRSQAREEALRISETDDILLCGISYWHVDRREIDELLISLNPDANFVFINPSPPRDLNAVLISIFKNYVHQSNSSEIGGVLNGEVI